MTLEEHLKTMVGDLIIQLAALRAELDKLRAEQKAVAES